MNVRNNKLFTEVSITNKLIFFINVLTLNFTPTIYLSQLVYETGKPFSSVSSKSIVTRGGHLEQIQKIGS